MQAQGLGNPCRSRVVQAQGPGNPAGAAWCDSGPRKTCCGHASLAWLCLLCRLISVLEVRLMGALC